jgi:GT2 family glycosyltransferase
MEPRLFGLTPQGVASARQGADRPDLTVLVVSWNTRDVLPSSLESVHRFVRGCRFETIVVDNASADGSAEALDGAFPNTLVIRNRDNSGFAAGCNIGLRHSSGRHVVLHGPDTLLQSDAYSPMVSYLDANPGVGVLGCQLRNRDGSLQHSCGNFPTLWRQALRSFHLGVLLPAWLVGGSLSEHKGDHGSLREVDWMIGTGLMTPRRVLEQVHGLCEDYFMYSEDLDLCYRIHRAGYRVVYSPATWLIHTGNHTGAMKFGSYRTRAIETSYLKFIDRYVAPSTARKLKAIIGAGALMDMLTHGVLFGLTGKPRRRDVLAVAGQQIDALLTYRRPLVAGGQRSGVRGQGSAAGAGA